MNKLYALLSSALITVVLGACTASGEDVVPPPDPPPPAAKAPHVTLKVTPAAIQPGEAAKITWTASDADTCVPSGRWESLGVLETFEDDGWDTGVMTEVGVHTFGITCTGDGGSDSEVQTLVVGQPPAPVINFSITPHTMQLGDTATIIWSTANATSCTGSDGAVAANWAGAQAINNLAGFRVGPVANAGEYGFTLSCTGIGGTASTSSIVTVDPAAPAAPPDVTFTSDKSQIEPGSSVTFSWSSANATACTGTGGATGDGWSAARPLSSTGTAIGPIAATGSYGYSLSCTGAGGTTTRTLTIVVNATPQPATVDISVSPASIISGDAARLTWTSTNSSSCTASGSWGGAQPLNGTNVSTGTITTPGTYSYALSCDGPGGGSTDTAHLTVSPPVAEVETFNGQPTTLVAGLPTTLSWSTHDATSCTASGGTGSDGWGGTVGTSSLATIVGPITPAGVYDYQLVCTGPGGVGPPAHVTITATAVPPPAGVAGLTITPNNISVGQTASVSWISTLATACTASGGAAGDGWTGAMPPLSLGTTVGPIATPGTYTYTLTCTGPGGIGAPQSASLVVGPGTPPAAVGTFTATPQIINVGSSTSLAWTTTNATSCTASGGALATGWLGSVPTSSAGTPVGPILTPGTWTYTLTCSGAGGTSGPMSVDVTVNVITPAPVINTFALNPTSITEGQSSSLNWATTNVTGCIASGGNGTDGWGGPVGTSSGGVSVGPVSAAGTVNYTLTCTGPGAGSATRTATLTITPAPPGAPTISLTANNQVQLMLQPSAPLTMRWNTTNATSCTATGGATGDGWAGSQPVSSTGVVLNTITTPGIYTYTLSCTGPGGSAAANAVVTVISSQGAYCGIDEPSTALRTPFSTVSTGTTGLCVLGCGVSNPGFAIDSNASNYSTMNVPLGLGTTVSEWVEDVTTTFPAGRRAGFVLSDPGTLLTAGLLQNVRVRTYLDGVQQETATVNDLLDISALGLLQDPQAGFVGFRTTKPFDRVRIDLSSLVSLLDTKRVYGACVTLH